MPTYECRCPEGHEFELFQRMSDDPVATCPECGQAAQRLLSAGGGLLFKGEGFYITDYRSADYKKKAEAESKKSGSSGASDGGSAAGSGSGGGTSSGGTSSGGGSAGGAAPSSSSD